MRRPGLSASPLERSGPSAGDWRDLAAGNSNSDAVQISGVASASPSAVPLGSRPTDRPGLPNVGRLKPIDRSSPEKGWPISGEGVASLVTQALVGTHPSDRSRRWLSAVPATWCAPRPRASRQPRIVGGGRAPDKRGTAPVSRTSSPISTLTTRPSHTMTAMATPVALERAPRARATLTVAAPHGRPPNAVGWCAARRLPRLRVPRVQTPAVVVSHSARRST
jgi:hypothetical protein